MLLVVKLLFVALAVFGQAKLFPEKPDAPESELAKLDLSVDHPELVLAKRAMRAQGLCRAPVDTASAPNASTASITDPEGDAAPGPDLAHNCP